MKIRLYYATDDYGDGSSGAMFFKTEEAATDWAENNEYYPEVQSIVLNTDDYEEVK